MPQQDLYTAMMNECLPLIRALADGRYAIAMGGSRGKGVSDARSDYDFRLYCDGTAGGAEAWPTPTWQEFSAAVQRWRARGIEIDHCWIRTFADIDAALAAWLEGELQPDALEWTVWGYHLLPDIYHQQIIEDPLGLLTEWKQLLSVYPPKLKQAILRKHLGSLRYWKVDYHYENKVARGDVVFLAGLSARLVHDIMQVLFALNETYFVGDGNNLDFAARFSLVPPHLAERVESALYPPPAEDRFTRQRQTLVELIEDVEALAASAPVSS